MANENKTQRNEGEGNKTAARHYNEDQREFAKSGKVEQAAEEAERALEGKEGDELKRAEEKGRSKAKDLDPQVTRDYSKSEKH